MGRAQRDDQPARVERAPAPQAPVASAGPAAPQLERLLALQRSAGNHAVSRMLAVARWDTPLQGGVPAGKRATDLAVFVQVIRDEENKLGPDERFNTKLMITKLRKLFYGSGGWDDQLIPGAASVAPLYEFEEVETGRRDYEGPGPNVIEFVDKRPQLVDAPAVLANPADIQEVRMPNGDFVDVGHVLAGLDAMNHPTTVAPFGMYEMSSNVDAVTWAGDLGSVLAEVLFQRAKLDRPLTGPEVQAQIDEYAPPQDMLGNVDAYAIGAAFDIASEGPAGSRVCAPGKKVSDILLEYYGAPGTASATGAAARSRRFTTFAHGIGLGPLSGSAFAGESAWLTRYELEVGKAGALYVGASSEISLWALPWSVGAKLGLMDGVRDSPFRRTLLEKFLAALKTKVAEEAASAAPTPAGVP